MLEAVVSLAASVRAQVRARVALPRLTMNVVAVALSVIGAAELARAGTRDARLGAAAILVATLAGLVVAAVLERRRWKDPLVVVSREVKKDDPPLAAEIDRATGLVLRTRADALRAERAEKGSSASLAATGQLADAFLAKKLARVDMDAIDDRAQRAARTIAIAAFFGAAIGLAASALDPFRVVEGLDVLAARGGRAPVRLVYLDDVDVVASPPSYIGQHEELLSNFDQTDQPRGTVLTVRGKPQRPGRKLVLTDGKKEILFVDDGKGNVVARWTVKETVDLRIAARFGGVVVEQKDALTVESVPDLAPIVKLQGAPKTVKLVDVPRLTLAYEATDDHGLTEIALVLRSGPKVEPRTLSRPGGVRMERGAHELSTQEAFFRGTYVPVEVTIEARDNDAVLGPKWGASPAFIVLPPLVGEPEALRYDALLRLRDALVDLLAPRVEADLKNDDQAKRRVESERKAQSAAMVTVENILAGTYGGLSIRGRVRRVVAGQSRRLREALAAYEKGPTKEAFEKLLKTHEQVVLAIDAAIQRVGLEDAKKVSKRLADVADEAALASRTARGEAEHDRGMHRLEAALGVLDGGGKQLAKLGSLGADLGDIARGGVSRITRARDGGDLVASELAATDLARRLREPVPSIGGGGRPGVESGPSDEGGVGEGDDASDADEQAEKNGKELDELIKRHQDELDRLEKALENATSPAEREALKKLAKEQAQAIREAVKGLPEQGLPGSAAEKAADGRKSADSMASELEKGNVKDALKRGAEALEALREAKKRGDKREFLDDEEVAEDATAAGNRIEEALEALEKAQKSAEDSAKERAKKDMKDAGENEGRLSERARDLKKRGEQGDASMPEEVLDRLHQAEQAMKEAQKRLEDGDADGGREKQKEAQRYLEMAREDEDPNESRDGDSRGEDGKQNFSQDAKIPDKNEHKGPEDFRRRVLEGLAKPGDARLKDAIRRYAEGLLQ